MTDHGTRSRYTSGCRCDLCRSANNEYQTARREVLRQQLALGQVNPTHGKYSTYRDYGCRCDLCRKAHLDAKRVAS